MSTVRRSGPALTLTLALTLAIVGCTSPTDRTGTAAPGTQAAPSTSGAPTAGAEATDSSASTGAAGQTVDDASGAPTADDVHRLAGLQDYPVEVTPDPGWKRVEIERGTLTYAAAGGIKVISVHAVEQLAGVPAGDLPQDVAGFLQEQRPDVVVSDVTPVTQSGRDAQRFTVTMSDGSSPTDLWSVVEGSSYKPLPDEPMEVVAVPSSQGLVLMWTESPPSRREATLAAFESALERVVVG